ncbi:MAG TPA: tRNA pseudouridine(54/55) synthase Pus10 [Candidatus Lokiarchaeia archaeon]|nr:tRNA pseudouridine(54/55) synthase Pus10 [Candidatus Lokiarchaeia archaeon]
MELAQKISDILHQFPICDACLGRQFSMLGTQTTNHQRGYSLKLYLTMQKHVEVQETEGEEREQALQVLRELAENGHHLPAVQILPKISPEDQAAVEKYAAEKFHCYLCDNIFAQVKDIAEIAVARAKDFEFDNFLVGTTVLPEISDREDEFRAKFQLTHGEAFKSHLNREIGKVLQKQFDVPVEFKEPQLLFHIELGFEKLEVTAQANPLFIYGMYQKFERGIPQTHWPCNQCNGKGCERCNFLGKMYPTSVEELASKDIVEAAQGSESKFHGAGREDIDARCLGEGRPFVIEIKNPRRRHLDLQEVAQKVNESAGGKISVAGLRFSTKDVVQKLKADAEYHKKKYFAVATLEPGLTEEDFYAKLKEAQEQISIIQQRTPLRVAHRRADLTREKEVFSIEGRWIDENTAEFTIETQGGTYVKELLSGDTGRTRPSITGIFGVQVTCKDLDIIAVENNPEL